MNKKPAWPHWPRLEPTLLSTEVPPDPRIPPLALAILEDYTARGESRGYDPYDANDDARAARAWAAAYRRR
jgi:hypothetical protein